MTARWQRRADVQTDGPSGARGRGALGGGTKPWAAPSSSRAGKPCPGSQTPIRKGKQFVNASSSQPDGFELRKTDTNRTRALGARHRFVRDVILLTPHKAPGAL